MSFFAWVISNNAAHCIHRRIHIIWPLFDVVPAWKQNGPDCVPTWSQESISVCCVFHCGNKFESFPPAGTHYIIMIHSLRAWRESCCSLHLYSVCVCIPSANAINNCSPTHPHILIKAPSLWLTKQRLLKLTWQVCAIQHGVSMEWWWRYSEKEGTQKWSAVFRGSF